MSLLDSPHRRFNPLTRDWVLVSPHRARRPWLGQVEKTPSETLPPYDPACYLCPGNARAGGVTNPPYTGTFVFDNDFAALLPDKVAENPAPTHPQQASRPERGQCRVVCFSPRPDLTLPELDLPAIEDVLETWRRESADLGAKDFIRYAQVFENKGAVMGCSNPHPHSQIWAQSQLPNEIAKELDSQAAYFVEQRRPLLADYLAEENRRKERLVFQNASFTALVPFWAVWPFEILLAAHRPVARLDELTITVYVPEDRVGEVSLGQTANVSVDSFPGVVFIAAVSYISDQAEFTPRNVQTVSGRKNMVFAIKLKLNDTSEKLKPGMPADVTFLTK